MADPVFLSDVKIWNGGYELQGDSNKVSLTVKNADLNDSRFGDTLEAEYPGVVMPEFSAAGFYNVTSDAVFFPRLHSDPTSWPVTVCPPNAPAAAAGADGNLAYTMTGAEFEYATGGKHGESLPYSFKKKPRSGGALVRGNVLLPKAAYAATTTGTARELGAISASQKLVAVLHVFAINGGSWVLTVESDTVGFGTPITRATFTAVTTAPNRLVVEANGPVTDTYWRVVLTKTGGTSITAAAAFGIVPIP